ncbi:MAG: FAD binding domain-containing protein [Planctomycetota bacterium]
MNAFEYALPENLSEALQFLEHPKTELKAGGLDLLDLMKEGIASPERLVNIRSLPELKFLKESEGDLLLGPNLTLAEIADDKKIQDNYRALAQAAGGAATPQIRNIATLGGNLCQRPRCWYFRNQEFSCLRKHGTRCFALEGENQYHAIFDTNQGCVIVHPSAMAVALIASHAQIQITSSKGSRSIPLEQFFISPSKNITKETVLRDNEIITEIKVPSMTSGWKTFYHKEKAKQSFDWPIAEVAVALKMDGDFCREASVVLGAAAPTPWRATPAEQILKNKIITRELARTSAEETLKLAKPLSQNAYKIRVFKAIIFRTLCWTAGINPFE